MKYNNLIDLLIQAIYDTHGVLYPFENIIAISKCTSNCHKVFVLRKSDIIDLVISIDTYNMVDNYIIFNNETLKIYVHKFTNNKINMVYLHEFGNSFAFLTVDSNEILINGYTDKNSFNKIYNEDYTTKNLDIIDGL